MVSIWTYLLIYGIPVFVVVFCIALSIIGKRVFKSTESEEQGDNK